MLRSMHRKSSVQECMYDNKFIGKVFNKLLTFRIKKFGCSILINSKLLLKTLFRVELENIKTNNDSNLSKMVVNM